MTSFLSETKQNALAVKIVYIFFIVDITPCRKNRPWTFQRVKRTLNRPDLDPPSPSPSGKLFLNEWFIPI